MIILPKYVLFIIYLFRSTWNDLKPAHSGSSTVVPRTPAAPNSQHHITNPFDLFAPTIVHCTKPSPPTTTTSLPPVPLSIPHTPVLPTAAPKTRLRKPQKGRNIAETPLRPHVPAGSRIHAWKTPYSLDWERVAHGKHSRDLLDRIEKALGPALATSTKSTYGAGILRFVQFCDKFNIPESDRMPADHYLVTAFVGEHIGSVSGGTVRGWLSGLKAWHDYHDAPWCGESRWVQMARVSVNKEGTAHEWPICAPITLAHLLALYLTLDFRIPFHCAIWALALTAFFGCHHLGEVTIPSRNGFNPKLHASCCSANIQFHTHCDGSKSVHFRIPWTKTTKEEGQP